MTPDDTTPAEAIEAAADALSTDPRLREFSITGWLRTVAVATVAVEAAAPHIAARAVAAERQRWAAQLADAVEGLHEMIGYVPDYFRDKWEHQAYIDRAEKALADLLAAQDTPPTATERQTG